MSDKIEIRFLPHNKTVEALEGADLLKVAREACVDIESSCDGLGTCGKCLVQQIEGTAIEPHHDERQLISAENLAQGVRLACRQNVRDSATFKVWTPSEERQRILSDGLLPKFDLNPKIRKLYVELDKPSLEDNLDDVSRIERALGMKLTRDVSLALLRQIPGVLRCDGFKATLILSGEDLIGLEPGNTAHLCYGVAVDIGTTTIVASLVNLSTGDEVAVSTVVNPQKSHGLDVLSRIQHAREHSGGLERLSLMVRNAIDSLIGEVCLEAGLGRHNVYEVAVAGNSTMMHFFLGVDPSGIGRSPYIPAFTRGVTFQARDLGLTISESCQVYCLPSVSSYIGADIVAGIISAELAHKNERALFIDIGTNGEIVFSSKEGMFACSCAAGPALEGMNISCGMRAADGAIEKVYIDSDVEIETIGGKPAIGLCGSGVIDAVSELLKAGIVDKSGRFVKLQPGDPRPWSSRLRSDKGPARFLLGSEDHTDRPVVITQKDIRQVQLAKGAILSGILVLLSRLGVRLSEIDRVYIAGAFGCHVRTASLAHIGVFPAELVDRTSLIGNSSKAGAILCLLSQGKRDEAVQVACTIQYIELSCYPDYDKLFTNCLTFTDKRQTAIL